MELRREEENLWSRASLLIRTDGSIPKCNHRETYSISAIVELRVRKAFHQLEAGVNHSSQRRGEYRMAGKKKTNKKMFPYCLCGVIKHVR